MSLNQISFDANHKLRIFPPEKLEKSETLKQQSQEFISKLNHFHQLSTQLTDVLSAQSNLLHLTKLQAIGTRNLIRSEQSNREHQKNNMKRLLWERRRELERVTEELEWLERAEREQKAEIERLGDHTIGGEESRTD
uniref:Uncharacterized protein n=1 Tax=Percolomonas cosmopolitus TaxID=63605 RepID=A0A7S1PKM7_9EUKA